MPTVRTGDIDTYYERRGSGPAIVFVHAAVLDHAQWAPQLETLSDAFTVVAYDVRGHGRTGGSAVADYSIDRFADDLAALVDALALDRPVICGLSAGGCIAQVYAARHPDRVAGLVLADTWTPPYLTLGELLQYRVLLPGIVPLVRLVGYERVERAMVWARERFSSGVGGDYERVAALREGSPRMTTAEFTKVMHALATFSRTRIDYDAITVPTLVLHGEHAPTFTTRHVPRLEALLADVETAVVPGAGHASNLDDPAFFSEAVRRFVTERVAPASPGER